MRYSRPGRPKAQSPKEQAREARLLMQAYRETVREELLDFDADFDDDIEEDDADDTDDSGRRSTASDSSCIQMGTDASIPQQITP